ncbi:SAM-dependent methyltransferase [Streptomyces goshikiensis]|uniref:SAM-dependent methyltransferase n=1 Tax=Streptomyces TaxID=1883 RepID=UPI000C26E4A2|nr:SAM-dependent methyltransferase [Streptomyces sp. CB02120-2]
MKPTPPAGTPEPAVAEVSMSVVSEARLHAHLLGDCESYAVDRALAATLTETAPWLPWSARQTRRHALGVVDRILDDTDIPQFLDLGCGLPPGDGLPLLPEFIREKAKWTPYRYVAVDRDPMAVAHTATTAVETTSDAVLWLDITEADVLLRSCDVERFDLGRPIAVLLHGVLEWIPDDGVDLLMAALKDFLPTGSALSITHATADIQPELTQRLIPLFETAGISFHPPRP